MTERITYILKQALRLHTGTWFTDTQLSAFLNYLNSQGIKIEEAGE